jgi:NTP pyrophosphatase (non-canonical NTP hydrolase)
MLVSAYDQFVQDSDQSRDKDDETRFDIALYGLAGEIGSVVSAVKKRLLTEGGKEKWNAANGEIEEELGDVIWYCFLLARLANPKKPINIFSHDIENLRKELSGTSERSERIRSVLDKSKVDEFLKAAKDFPRMTRTMEFSDYQNLAFLTARTPDRTLVEVCLAVLWQLSAQLFRSKLPDIELELNKSIVDRPFNQSLGEIAWHIAALASIYGLNLGDIAKLNKAKVSYRLDRDHPTPLHDEEYTDSERIPRKFKIAVVTIGAGRSRMYLNGRRLGDDLTDNAHDEDGYRFHDMMHLANAAKLGWSPVLRSLMNKKRRSRPIVDEVEDGARAKIVEEAIIKAIHSEGQRLSADSISDSEGKPEKLFSNGSEITFRFLKFIHNFVNGLEVSKNRYWEWEDAIVAGHDLFYKLRCEGQGTISVDLNTRTVDYVPEVTVEISGTVAGLGSARYESEMIAFDRRFENEGNITPVAAATKLAVLDAIGMREPDQQLLKSIQISEVESGISVRATGAVQQALWDRRIVAFRTTCVPSGTNGIYCTAIAIADD